LARKGIIENVGVFEDFTRGFTRGKVNFDFVDVGSGKDRADEKIVGTSSVCSLQSYTDLYTWTADIHLCPHLKANTLSQNLSNFSRKTIIVAASCLVARMITVTPAPWRRSPTGPRWFPG
jgi:hypothetical protein